MILASHEKRTITVTPRKDGVRYTVEDLMQAIRANEIPCAGHPNMIKDVDGVKTACRFVELLDGWTIDDASLALCAGAVRP